MKRLERHRLIKRLVQEKKIGTQEELKAELEKLGIRVTQATLSRDLREIGLLKLRDEEGNRFYSLTGIMVDRFQDNINQYILSVARASVMLVIKTELGEANVLANLIDAENKQDILGTIAGADTLLIICKDEDTALAYESVLN